MTFYSDMVVANQWCSITTLVWRRDNEAFITGEPNWYDVAVWKDVKPKKLMKPAIYWHGRTECESGRKNSEVKVRPGDGEKQTYH